MDELAASSDEGFGELLSDRVRRQRTDTRTENAVPRRVRDRMDSAGFVKCWRSCKEADPLSRGKRINCPENESCRPIRPSEGFPGRRTGRCFNRPFDAALIHAMTLL